MIDRVAYLKRTIEHIHRVQKRAIQLVELIHMDPIVATRFLTAVSKHDQSKFSDVQIDGYSAYFNNSDEPIEEDKENFEKAWKEHYMTENHHLIGLSKRGEKITPTAAFEIACDLRAMSDEFGDNPIEYFSIKWIAENEQYIDSATFEVLCGSIRMCLHLFNNHPIK